MEYDLLEEQLQKTLAGLEKREKQLAEAELQVASCLSQTLGRNEQPLFYRRVFTASV